MKMENLMRMAVVGSRTFDDRNLLDRQLAPHRDAITEIVSGGAAGADLMAEAWAGENDLPVQIFRPETATSGACDRRNRAMVDYCDAVIAFWDGRSSGTKYTVDYAERSGKPVTTVMVKS